jgi:hypothetical protein
LTTTTGILFSDRRGDLDLALDVEGLGDLDLALDVEGLGDLDLALDVEGLGDLDLALEGSSSPIPFLIRNSIRGFFVNFDQFLRPLLRAISFN